MAEATMNLNDVLGGCLDDLPDVPAFVTWPAGAYRCLVSVDLKEIKDQPVVEAKFIMKEVIEMMKEDSTPPAIDSTNSEAFFLNNDLGIGKLKEFLKPFAAKFQENNVQALIDMIKNIEVDVVNKPRQDKNDKERWYFTSVALEVV